MVHGFFVQMETPEKHPLNRNIDLVIFADFFPYYYTLFSTGQAAQSSGWTVERVASR